MQHIACRARLACNAVMCRDCPLVNVHFPIDAFIGMHFRMKEWHAGQQHDAVAIWAGWLCSCVTMHLHCCISSEYLERVCCSSNLNHHWCIHAAQTRQLGQLNTDGHARKSQLGRFECHLIWRARVPSILALSYFVMYRVVIFGLSEGCAGPSMMSGPVPASGISASPSSSSYK